MAMVQPAGDDRRFVIEQIGLVRILTPDGEVLGEPFLDLRHRIVDQWPEFDEKGLLGLAFHPDFANNGKFYVAYSVPTHWKGDLDKHFWWAHTNVIEEYTVSADDPNVADPSTVRQISAIDWPQFNHNGHWIGFGPDGMLYISTGDGGYANDWGIGHNVLEGNGQDLTACTARCCGSTSTARPTATLRHPGRQPVRRRSARRCPRSGRWACATPGAAASTGRRQRAVLRRRAAEQLRGGVDRLERRQPRLAAMEATHCFDFEAPDTHPAELRDAGLIAPILEYKNCTARPEGCTASR